MVLPRKTNFSLGKSWFFKGLSSKNQLFRRKKKVRFHKKIKGTAFQKPTFSYFPRKSLFLEPTTSKTFFPKETCVFLCKTNFFLGKQKAIFSGATIVHHFFFCGGGVGGGGFGAFCAFCMSFHFPFHSIRE